MTDEQFEAWDEQTLDPHDVPPLSDSSDARHRTENDTEDGAAQAHDAANSVKKPVPAGRKPRKPRQKSDGATAKGRAQGRAQASNAFIGEVDELEAQGFTRDEAIRLLDVSDRAANSGEALEAEAMLRR